MNNYIQFFDIVNYWDLFLRASFVSGAIHTVDLIDKDWGLLESETTEGGNAIITTTFKCEIRQINLTSVSFSFYFCKMGLICTPKGCCEVLCIDDNV